MSHKHPDKSLADPSAVDPAMRHRLIQEAAWALHEKNGFIHGHDFDDWLIAEAYVDDRLRRAAEKPPQRTRAS